MIKIEKILAVGTNHRYITINVNGYKKTIHTNDNKLYEKLKQEGIPTGQSMRQNKHWKKEKNK